MTFEYDEEMIQQIKSTGMTIEEFDEMLSKMVCDIQDFVEKMRSIVRDFVENIKEIFAEIIKEIEKVEPRQRYKIVKKLGVENYEVFFERKTIHRSRSCC